MSDGWSFGGSILTFAFPMLLFIVVAVTLYVLYTKPTVVPGHRTSPVQRPVSHTAIPGIPAVHQVGNNLHGRAPVDPVDAAADDEPGAAGGPGGPGAPGTAVGENAPPEVQE